MKEDVSVCVYQSRQHVLPPEIYIARLQKFRKWGVRVAFEDTHN